MLRLLLPLVAAFAMLAEPSAGRAQATGLEARGLLEARSEAVLAAEIQARIEAMPFRDGQRFAAGEVLVRFACDLYQAQLDASAAARNAAARQLEHNRRLAALNSIGEFEVRLAQANLAEADAQVAVGRAMVERCTLHAPFAGRVVRRRAHPHESVAVGAPLLEVVDEASPTIRLLLPSRELATLRRGSPFLFTVDETGARYRAEVTEIGARIDPASQMIVLIGAFTEPTEGLLAGMSGTAAFAAPAG
jgi:membrane fusion protein, multidrug efflux system